MAWVFCKRRCAICPHAIGAFAPSLTIRGVSCRRTSRVLCASWPSFAVASPHGMGATERSVGFLVDDVEEAVADLTSAGVTVDAHVSSNERDRYVHFTAPDGQVYELVERRR